jgi:hypothetical protein
MLRKSLIFMMLLMVTASLVGLSGFVYQFVGGQGQSATPQPQPQVQKVIKGVIGSVQSEMRGHDLVYASSGGKVCLAEVALPGNRPNNLGAHPGGVIELLASDESMCVLFGQSKIGKTQIMFRVEKLTSLDAIPPTLREDFPPNYPYVYRVHQLRMY